MAQPRPWKEEVIDALNDLGGVAHLDHIYQRIKQRGRMDFNQNSHWDARVRSTLETSKEVFYNVYGTNRRNGVWGLVEREIQESEAPSIPDSEVFPEGKIVMRRHLCRERNKCLIKIAKSEFIKRHGHLYCEICGFDFGQTYGEVGRDFIEAHHIKALSELSENEGTRWEDLLMVCSNCHSMIHRKRPWLCRENLEDLLRQNSL